MRLRETKTLLFSEEDDRQDEQRQYTEWKKTFSSHNRIYNEMQKLTARKQNY